MVTRDEVEPPTPPFQGRSHPKLCVDSASGCDKFLPVFVLLLGAKMEPSKVVQICLLRFCLKSSRPRAAITKLRHTLASTNVIESAFSIVRDGLPQREAMSHGRPHRALGRFRVAGGRATVRKSRAIGDSVSDPEDARRLARLVQVGPELLSPIQRRCAKTQNGLALVRAREVAVETERRLSMRCAGS